MSSIERPVRRRRVFYIPGFDPHPPRRYRELYRREGAAQARVSGYQLRLDAVAGNRSAWTVCGEFGGEPVQAEMKVLVWSDLVRQSMDRSIARTYQQLIHVVWVYVSTGALFRLIPLGKGPILAGFYPILGLMLQGLFAVLVGGAVYSVVSGLEEFLSAGSAGFVGLTLGCLTAAVILVWMRRLDGSLYIHYLMHDLAYVAQARGAYPDELSKRIREFASQISKALKGAYDEVLVVGHSSGASLAISALSELLGDEEAAQNNTSLALLTLGHAIPMQSFLPNAVRLRGDLHRLSQDERITWIDVSAPSDGCCFALTDPVSVSGVAPECGKRWPLVLSAAFSRTLSDERRAQLKHRYFKLHFQYLCAFDAPESYDYFAITAGPRTLADRFEGRVSSKQRIDKPLSAYSSMAA